MTDPLRSTKELIKPDFEVEVNLRIAIAPL